VAGRHSSEWRPGFGELTMKLEIRAGFLGERDVPPREPEIRAVLAACLFHSEGHRNAHPGCGRRRFAWAASVCCA